VRTLTNKDMPRIVKQWLNGKPVRMIAEFFQVTRKIIYQIINMFMETGGIPFLQKPGRKPKEIDEETEAIILETYKQFNLGPVHLEKKIEEVHGIHTPHNTIYKVMLKHGGGKHEEEKAEEVGSL
jgi:putative transposase